MRTRCALRSDARSSCTTAKQWAASRVTVARSTADACALVVRRDWTQGVSSARKWLRKWTDEVAPLEALVRWLAARRCTIGRRLLGLWRDDGRPMHAAGLCAKRCALVAAVRRSMAHDARDCAAIVALNSRWRPPAGRRSGDVVTAGLISSRVWFGPVPGSP
ncbi:MATE efflux family protein isoform 1 [Dorcoceras hygrometricum]|uniref:MATE efflux family protein isoform 1 n=1 Tax=Dorcoceras hygrometricum TaxID=472368 RepID=A0A2Z6ZW13_9LAMI|nr:MATE efflux family protein isoform 1 [Dorcoceras hygrometricum]